ncbi:type II toxin-antitoxin system VapC family toxin [Aetokthonos hydrillicola Thurmond2011]|jgi:tRNA(fMet)-specific endonuclease VapC|uniref:Type II toxin-antitoxin system VapC family toxin n=1 Tax=Aetokthonos hydrillicola Thurmond2011 TaxID=2712845 RepID=A0AAP5I7A8_9CYAN|nr:type II toxin-antitoxin system VapC family toxin [Aetokthonos hydrillicola]MBO3458800.1 type II toxin-antitoxin system VapC family toxin [Aetokthonos hydrillicola CCALA 1050]MBW4585547.1 type II toxin-antitoxin system VapC family toxin [Aetokthonos hydrillicola CCALA 1050]MDR9896171.1 type II toxin-antitoxin system VapC family toxin [Aetokthonos hydrillicola Thurmond2011]
MNQGEVLLDTDTLSAIMRQNTLVIAKAQAYLEQYDKFTFSIITRYEILRGLKAKGANKQIQAFEQFCGDNIIIPLTDEIIVQASDIYAELRKKGTPIGDADILIAASAMVNHMAVVTNNQSHFGHIVGLTIHNWLV